MKELGTGRSAVRKFEIGLKCAYLL